MPWMLDYQKALRFVKQKLEYKIMFESNSDNDFDKSVKTTYSSFEMVADIASNTNFDFPIMDFDVHLEMS